MAPPKTISKPEFENMLGEALKQKNVDEELLYLFYQLDVDKKGYLDPSDIVRLFKAVGKNISLSEV